MSDLWEGIFVRSQRESELGFNIPEEKPRWKTQVKKISDKLWISDKSGTPNKLWISKGFLISKKQEGFLAN